MKNRHIFAASVLFAISATSFAQSSGYPDRVNSRYPNVQDVVTVPSQARVPAVLNGSNERVNSRYPGVEKAEPARSRAEVVREMEEAFADPAFLKAREELYRG